MYQSHRLESAVHGKQKHFQSHPHTKRKFLTNNKSIYLFIYKSIKLNTKVHVTEWLHTLSTYSIQLEIQTKRIKKKKNLFQR